MDDEENFVELHRESRKVTRWNFYKTKDKRLTDSNGRPETDYDSKRKEENQFDNQRRDQGQRLSSTEE